MHGVLLGVTKTLMYLWFSSTHSGKPYFIGKSIQDISKCLQQITPPDYVERLPRDLEKHYTHFKATELQTWLLFYGVPCLYGHLPEKYLSHFALLSESIHLLLKDHISQKDLEDAEEMLKQFYKDFANLYPAGCSGLNVHNIGSHLVDFVRMWGPIYSWSCFGFEDCNAHLLQSVHGTGNVINQMLRTKMVQFMLCEIDQSLISDPCKKKFLQHMKSRYSRTWANVKRCQNCSIAGQTTVVHVDPFLEVLFLEKANADSLTLLRKVLRIQIGEEKIYGKEYGRMKKRVCYLVLCKDDSILSVDFFILNTESLQVYAFGNIYEVLDEPFLFNKGGHHIIRVQQTPDVRIIDVERISEKLFLITPHPDHTYVSRMPNIHGRGIFK